MASDRIVIGPYVVGEIPSPLEYSFLDSAGQPINLTGYTAKLVVRPTDSNTPASYGATVSAPLAGTVTYTWDGTELAQPGPHWAEVWVGNGTNRFASLRLEFTVRGPVGAVPVI